MNMQTRANARTAGLTGALCTVLMLAAMPWSAVRAEDKPPEGWSITPLLPPDTLGVLSINDAAKAIEKYKKTGLWQIYANPDIQQAFRAPMMQAQFFLGMAELQLGTKISEITSWFSQGEITVAILGVDKKNLRGEPFPDMLVSIQARSKAGAAMEELVKRLDQLKAATNGAIMVSQVPAGNATLNKVTVPAPDQPGGQVNFYYTNCDGNIIISVGDGRLEKILAMREKHKAGVAKPAPGTPAEVLAQVASFEKVREKAGAENDFMLYVNVESLLNNPMFLAAQNEQQQREMEIVGLKSIRAISYCSGARGKGIRELFFIDVPAATRKGVLALADGDGLQPDALAAAPKSALVAGAMKISPEKITDKLLELAAIDNPNVKEQANAWLLAVGQQLNLDVKKELFNALTGQGVFSISLLARHPKLPVSFPQPLLSLAIKDQTSLKNMLKALRGVAKENLDFTDTIVGEREIVTARERFPQGREAGQFCYVIDKTDLIVSLYPLALREELKRRDDAAKLANGGYATAGSLAEDADFKTARGALSGNPQAMMYIDSGALAVAAYDLLIPIAQLAQRRPEVDVAALPTSEFIMQNFGGTVFGFSTDADGILAEGFSPTGALSFVAAIPAALRGRRFANRGADRMANQQQTTMEAIARDLRAYAAANGGKLPIALKDMQPKLLADVPAETLDTIVYRGPQDAPNKVVAHTSERTRGAIVVLTQDGTVALIRRSMLGKVLTEGYVEQAAQPAAGGDGTVKPPRPPEF